MSYNYETEKKEIFTEIGQRQFLSIRDNTHRLIELAGSARMDKIIANQTGSNWIMMACVDRLVELGEIHETSPAGCAGQYRTFTKYPIF